MTKDREPTRCGMTGRVIPPEDAGLCNNAEGCDNCCHMDEDEVIQTDMCFAKVAFTIIAVGLLVVMCVGIARGEEIPKEVYCAVGEAEGEGYAGLLAVSEAIRNRGTLRGVYGCKAPRVINRKYSDKVLRDALRAWKESAHTNTVRGATHWEGTAFKTPYWAKDMIVTARINNQIFYKEVSNAKR
jgi:hypothetical protein